jgi:hypothetical protein
MELAITLARALVRRGGYDPADVKQSYARWRRFSGAAGTVPPAHLAPIGVLAAGDPPLAARLAREDACLAEAAPLCVEACAVYAGCTAALVDGGAATDAVALLRLTETLLSPGTAAAAAVLRALRDPRTAAGDADLRSSPVLRGLRAAFDALGTGGNDRSTGGAERMDAGTLESEAAAAVAGAVQGAYHGAAGMHAASLAFQATRAVGGGSGGARPNEYWPDELPVLADALLAITAGPAVKPARGEDT